MTDKKTPNDHADEDEYLAPKYERIVPKKEPFIKRVGSGFTKPYSDPNQRSTYVILISVAALAVSISFIFGGGVSDKSEKSPRYTTTSRGQDFGPAIVGSLSEEEVVQVISENETKRANARNRDGSYTPHRLGLINTNTATSTAQQVGDGNLCLRTIEEGQRAKLAADIIAKNAISAVTENGIELDKSEQEVLAAAQECSRIVAEKLNLNAEQAIQLAAKAAMLAAQKLGLTKEEQIALAAAAAQSTAALHGLTKEEQIAAAARAAQEAAAALGYSKEEQIALAAKAAQQAAAELGLSKEEQIALAAKAAQQAAADLGLSKEEQIAIAASTAQRMAADLGLSKEEQIALAAKAAQQAAAELGLSKEEQIAIAASTARRLAADLGLSKEEQIALAAKAAQLAAATLGLSNDEQIAIAARAAQEAAAALGFSKEDQIAFAATAARQAAAEIGLNKEEQIAFAAQAAQQAAEALGFSKEDQVRFASEAARNAAEQLGLNKEDQIKFAAKSAQEIAEALGFDEETQIAMAAQAAQQAAEKLGFSKEEQIAFAGKAAQQAAAALGYTAQQQIDAASKAAFQTAKSLGLSQDEQIKMAALAAAAAAKNNDWSSENISKAAAKAAMEAAALLNKNQNQQVLAASAAAQMIAKSEALSPFQQVSIAKEAAKLAADSLGITGKELEQIVELSVTNAIKATGLEGANSQELKNRFEKLKNRKPFTPQQISNVIARIEEEKQTKGSPKVDDGSQFRKVATVMELTVEETAEENSATVASNPTTVESTDNAIANEKTSPPDVAAGNWMYAVQTTRVNTDNSRPEVVGVVVGGPFDGAKIIGTWEKNSEWGETIGLTFNRMNYEGKEIENVELIAFNPETRMPGFATDVDHHWLTRFVGLSMKALSVGGVAAVEAKRNITQNTNNSGDPVGTTIQALDSDEARNLFISHSFGVLGEYGQKYTARPITIDTYNETMQLLVMNNLYKTEAN